MWIVISAGCIECSGDGDAGIEVEGVYATSTEAFNAAASSSSVTSTESDISVAFIQVGKPALVFRVADGLPESTDLPAD